MKIETIGMNICPQFYFHIEVYKVETGHTPFSWYMGYIHYYLQNIWYHLYLMMTDIHNLKKS
jgi:hypothetical protein